MRACPVSETVRESGQLLRGLRAECLQADIWREDATKAVQTNFSGRNFGVYREGDDAPVAKAADAEETGGLGG